MDKPGWAVRFLLDRGGGVMDFIAHFWERLAQTPPLARNDLHLVMTRPWASGTEQGQAELGSNGVGDHRSGSSKNNAVGRNLNDEAAGEPAGPFTGAMLYVPKAHRADVLATTPAAATAFAQYILGGAASRKVPSVAPGVGGGPEAIGEGDGAVRPAIDFLTGGAAGIDGMLPLLLPALRKRGPSKRVVNAVMRLPERVAGETCSAVRAAREGDAAVLNRWRKLYKEERGILFDADVEAWIANQVVFVLENQGQVASLAKFDLVLSATVEIGGVFTFPEARNRGFGRALVGDLVYRIRSMGKTPVLQVDRANRAALQMYEGQGWECAGDLARVWLA